MICVTKLIARCKLLLSQRLTLSPYTPLHANACSLTRTYRSFRPRTAALLLEASLPLRPTLLLHPTSRAPDQKSDMRSNSRAPTRRPTRSHTLLCLDCTELPIPTLQRRSSCRKDAASSANRQDIELSNAQTRKLESTKSTLMSRRTWEKNSL